MKQVQVFKKTLLSLAVVSAFGGYGTVTQAKVVKGGGTTLNPSPSTSTSTSSTTKATPSLSTSTPTKTKSTPKKTKSTPKKTKSAPKKTKSTPTPTASTPTPTASTPTPTASTPTPTASTPTPTASTPTPTASTPTPTASTTPPTASTTPPTASTTPPTASTTPPTASTTPPTASTTPPTASTTPPTASTTPPTASTTPPTASTSGTTATGQQQPKSFNPITFVQGNDKEINEHLALLKDKFNGLTGSDYHTKSIQYSSKGLLDHLQKADDDVDDLNKKLASAEAIAANDYDANQKPKTANVKKDEAKKVADLKDKVKEAEEHAKKARESLVAFAKANQNKLGLKDNFLLAATQGAAVNKSGPSVVLQEKNAEPAEKVDFAALRKTSEGVTADASKVGLDASPVQAQGEDPAKFQARVTEARKKLDGLSRDDFRKIFLVKDPKAQNGHVAPEVIRLKGYDLRVPELYDAFMDRVQNDVPELFDASAAAANSTDVVFTGGTVELDGVKTSPESPLPGVHFATPKGAKAKDPKDPYGTYIVAEDSDLYQESIGSEDNPVDTFVVENSKFHAEGVVRASKVSIKDSEVAGYNKTANKETALQVVAAAYKDTAIRGNSTQSAAGPVIARKRTIANFEGLKNSNLNVEGFQDVTITSSNLKSDGLGVNAAAENMTIKDSVINMASIPTGPVQIVAQNLVVEGKSVISHKEAIPGGSVDTLTTIRGANLKKTFIETTTGKNGQQTTKEVEEDAVDTFKVGMGSQVWANVEDFEEGTVAGTLMSDRIGSKDPKDPKQDKLINKLVLEQGADLRKYSKTGNTIYGSEKLDLTVGNGTTVIHDVDGFHSIVLDGGLLEGNLTGSPVPKPFSGDNAFDGSTVEMKSGTYQGGNVEDVKSFTISGPVHLMPGSSKLGKVDAGKVEETDVKPVVIKGKVKVKVDVKSGVVFDIAKSNLDKSQSPVQVEGDVTFEKGSGLAAVVDFNSGKADPTVAYMNIAGSSGVLKLKGGNRVYLRPDKLNNEQTYKVSKDLYDEYKKDPTGSYDLKVVEYQSMDGKFEAPVSEYPLINVAPVPAVTPLGSPGSYQIKLRFNPDPRSAFRSVFNMSSNDAEVASAALLSSLEAGGDAGKEMFGAIQKVGYQKIASENQWDPHVGMGMAAVTVTQKANQSISRHLNRHRTGIATGDMFESKGVWGEYFYSDGEMDDKRDVRGFKNKVNGINLGLDALLNDQLTVGFAFTYGDVKTETNKSGRDASGDTYMGTLYTGWTMENYFFDTMWSYGRGDIDMKRKTSQGTYKSDTKSDTLGARLVGGYNYQFNQWLIQPQIEFNYVKVKFDDFKEKQDQGPLPQSVKLDDFEVMELGAGLKLMADYDVANGMLKPEFTLMGYHDFKDKKPEVQGTFLNGGRTYHVSGRDREQNRVLAGVGVKYEMNNNLTLGLNYDYNWQGDYTAHGIVGSVRYDF